MVENDNKNVESEQTPLDKNIKLATYASRCIENEILMFLRKVSKQKVEISLDETLNKLPIHNPIIKQIKYLRIW